MLTYLLLSLLMIIFTPEIGDSIATGINSAWGTHMDGGWIWIIGLVVSSILD